MDPSLDQRVHDLLGEAQQVVVATILGDCQTSQRDDLLARLRLCERDALEAGRETSAYDLREAITVLEAAVIPAPSAMTPTVPLCPKCGKVPEETLRQTVSSSDFLIAPQSDNKQTTVVTYHCSSCGTIFEATETQIRDLPPSIT